MVGKARIIQRKEKKIINLLQVRNYRKAKKLTQSVSKKKRQRKKR